MSEALSPQHAPYAVECEQGKTYYWCSCGISKNQPYCDGSHRETDFTPVAFEAEETKKMFLCGCKKTTNTLFCDGSHNK
ncbi:MAG: glutamate synthase [Gammaproteobacteria bacterium]|nr:glutamate synthase [Gammaproteobacteria bacterium]